MSDPADVAGDTSRGVQTLVAPEPREAATLIADALARGALVAVVGRCVIEYEGRTATNRPAGDRHLLLKPDGVALVHADAGHRPVNWQPPGGTHDVRLEDGRLVVETTRDSPAERLVVRFESLAHVGAFAVSAPAGGEPTGTEADLKARVLADPDVIESGFRPLATERATPGGAVDIYGEDAAGRTVVVELKRRRAGPDAVGQLDRYVSALERDLHAEADVRGILVAPSITERAGHLLAEKDLEFVALTPDREDP